MVNKNTRRLGTALVAAVWLALAVAAWCKPAGDISNTERRKLAQFPVFSIKNVLSGQFVSGFESYTLDQFPLRDSFRRVKAAFHCRALGQGDNNGIYVADGYAAALEYPLDETSVNNAAAHFQGLYDRYLKDSGGEIYFAIVPDKGYYLAESNGYPAMDYDKMFSMVCEALPWAQWVYITQSLAAADYYRTDSHWRQEELLETAAVLCASLGVTAPRAEDFTRTAAMAGFYGVYYGQGALSMPGETLYIMESPLLDGCAVYNHETGETTGVYDYEKLAGRDPYDVFLSGAAAVLTIENPNGQVGKELIVFRDSFGSSLVPLILRDYAQVTVVDTRYVSPEALGDYVDFHGQDVLMVYSTTVLNNSAALK